jgi:beta-lactamase regulating signal transducer with metallopeptidase domain
MLLFFHPAVWYAVRKMQVERELACDHAVISESPARRGSTQSVWYALRG